MATTDDFSPRYVGDTSRPLLCSFTTHDGTIDPLTGVSGLTMHFRDRSSGIIRQGTGNFSNINASAGTAQYNWDALDVATAGFFDFQVSATMPDGPAHWDSRVLEMRAVF